MIHWRMNWVFSIVVALLVLSMNVRSAHARTQWTPEQANAWYKAKGWRVGCNYIPRTAINQLEMWQAETFDPKTIDQELGLAEGLGFNSIRVFLHDLLWQQDRDGFLKRMDAFLTIADRHHIGVMFVLFDGVWDPDPRLGKQHEPVPFLHNSGWVQSPGRAILKDDAKQDQLKDYVVGVIGHFKDDKRVDAWDVFNEPDNPNSNSYGATGSMEELAPDVKESQALKLLMKEFAWARSADPSQPLTCGVWRVEWPKLRPVERAQLDESDVVSYHAYSPLDGMRTWVKNLRDHMKGRERPLLCTEYMARPQGSRFKPILGYLKEENIGAYNWGFVQGKTGTNYAWNSWETKPADRREPPVWFHEIYKQTPDGLKPYDPNEVKYIRSVTGK